MLFVFTGEIFPTDVRGVGYGLCNIGARIGGVLAPYALVLPSYVTCAAFGALALVAARLTRRMLVETLGQPLSGTMAEDEAAPAPAAARCGREEGADDAAPRGDPDVAADDDGNPDADSSVALRRASELVAGYAATDEGLNQHPTERIALV